MNVYSRARKHIDMKRVKELKVENEIKKLEKQHQLLISEIKEIEKERSKHYDWRTGKDLTETMVTTGALEVSLSAEGDTDLVGLGHETPDTSVQPGVTNVNGTYTFGPVNSEYGFASTLTFTQNIDLSLVDTLVFDFTAGDIDDFDLIIGGTSIYPLSISSGRKVITLRQSDRKQNKALMWSLSKNSGDPVGTNRISGLALQRRTPLSVFVGLDDPEANSFVRGGLGGSEERRQQLKDQLEAGNELMIKLGLDPSKTSPGDIELADSPGPGVRFPKFSDAPGSGRTRGQAAPPVPDYRWSPEMQQMVPNIPRA